MVKQESRPGTVDGNGSGSSPGLTITRARLADLSNAEPEEGFPLPTEYASLTSLHLLNQAALLLPSAFPRATVSVEEQGGVFIYWIKPSITVQLTVPNEHGKLFYLRMWQDPSSQVYQNPDGKQLAECLMTFERQS